MIEISNLNVALAKLDGTPETERNVVRGAVLRRLHVAPGDIGGVELRRRSVDARKKSAVHLTYTVRTMLRGGEGAERALLAKLARRRDTRGIRSIVPSTPMLPSRVAGSVERRPVVVGAGCAGLFCALALASAGLEPLLVERGDDAARRTKAVERFNETGELDRHGLALRAFDSAADTRRLEQIEMPAIKARLTQILTNTSCAATAPVVAVVEVPLLDRVEDLLPLADDVLVVAAPMALRRCRAVGRGMTGADFDRRAAQQPSEEYLRSHATDVIDNSGTAESLEAAVDAWWKGERARG